MSSGSYREPDLNRHVPCGTQDFKSCASTNSAIPAQKTPLLEAPIRFELMHKGFADLSLTTWVRRQKKSRHVAGQSGKRDSNPRHQPWQGCALPTELLPHKLCKYKEPLL